MQIKLMVYYIFFFSLPSAHIELVKSTPSTQQQPLPSNGKKKDGNKYGQTNGLLRHVCSLKFTR